MKYPTMNFPTMNFPAMDYAITKRSPCSVCGLDTFRHTGWFLVVENRWLDRLKILSWHSSLATQKDMKSVCCRQHLKALIAHWLTQASLRLPPLLCPPMPIGSDPNLIDVRSRSARGGPVGRRIGGASRVFFPASGQVPPPPWNPFSTRLSLSELKTSPTHWSSISPTQPESSHGLSLQ